MQHSQHVWCQKPFINWGSSFVEEGLGLQHLLHRYLLYKCHRRKIVVSDKKPSRPEEEAMVYCFEKSWKQKILNLLTCADSKTNIKNSAYRRRWIPELVRKGAPITKWTKRTKRRKRRKTKKKIKSHISCFRCHVSGIMCHLSLVPCHLVPMPQIFPG